MTASLLDKLQANGFQARIVAVRHLGELQAEIAQDYKDGLIDELLYEEYLSRFFALSPLKVLNEGSMIVAAKPSPQTRVVFNLESGPFLAILPPTYVGGVRVAEELKHLVSEQLPEYRWEFAILPLKLLAVKSGLAEYGKNNITYIPGTGSFQRLAALYSDWRSESDSWEEPKVMSSCNKCRACLTNCPTHAIREDRFLIQAEKCLSFRNEISLDFPDWIDPAWHNCLVGCMKCQSICPENRKALGWIEGGGEFSVQETALLLKGAQADSLPSGTVAKLQALDLIDYLPVLSRNLRALVERAS